LSNATDGTILSTKSNIASTLLPFLATMLNENSSFRQSLNRLNQKPKNGNNVEATFDFVERIVQVVAFDNVASTSLPVVSTLLLVLTGH